MLFRSQALHDKVNSLLSMCDLDTPLNGLLLHSDTLCILRNNYHEDLQESVEDGQETSQEEDEEDEEAEQRYYRQEGRYYRQAPDDEAEARKAPGGGTTASSRTGSTAGGTAHATGASPKATVSNGTCRVSTTYYRQR